MDLDELNALLAISAAAPYAAVGAFSWMKRSGASKAVVHFLQNQFTQVQQH